MALTKITPQMFDTSATTHDLNVDNGTFVVDGSASRVGIGKTNPSTLLDVNGTATATTFVGALTGNVTGNLTGTILTAAQTNITSVGTLSALAVNSGTTNTVATFTSSDAGAGINLTDNSGTSTLQTNGANLRVGVDEAGAVSSSAIQFRVDGSTKATLDSNGNLLVGATTTTNLSDGTGNDGVHLNPSGTVAAARTSNVTAVFNRLSSNGDIIRFNKDGATVGSIQSRAGVVTTVVFNPASGNGAGLSGGTKAVVPADEAGIIDNDINLGVSTHKFKNGYFAGTVYAAAAETTGVSISATHTIKNLNITNGQGSIGGTTPRLYSSASGVLDISTNSVRRLTIDASGNVSVLTSGVALNAPVLQVTNANVATYTGTTPAIHSPASAAMAFSMGGSERMRINSSGITSSGHVQAAGALKVTESGTAQVIMIGNQDSAGTNKPAIVMGVNGYLRFGHGNSWSSEGGTFTEVVSLINNNLTVQGNALIAGSVDASGAGNRMSAYVQDMFHIGVEKHGAKGVSRYGASTTRTYVDGGASGYQGYVYGAENWVPEVFIPYSPNQVYRLSVSIYQLTGSTATSGASSRHYLGVIGYDENFNFVNVDNLTTYQYNLGSNVTVSTGNFYEADITLKGWQGSGQSDYNKMDQGTVYIRPLWLCNYQSAGGTAVLTGFSIMPAGTVADDSSPAGTQY